MMGDCTHAPVYENMPIWLVMCPHVPGVPFFSNSACSKPRIRFTRCMAADNSDFHSCKPRNTHS